MDGFSTRAISAGLAPATGRGVVRVLDPMPTVRPNPAMVARPHPRGTRRRAAAQAR